MKRNELEYKDTYRVKKEELGDITCSKACYELLKL